MAILCTAAQIYLLLIFARIVLSWFPITPGTALASVSSFLYGVTEPVLGPLRRVLPPVRAGAMALDLSPIVVLLVIQLIVLPLVCR
jgi:YggT family protein